MRRRAITQLRQSTTMSCTTSSGMPVNSVTRGLLNGARAGRHSDFKAAEAAMVARLLGELARAPMSSMRYWPGPNVVALYRRRSGMKAH